jgi:hypothetical protein
MKQNKFEQMIKTMPLTGECEIHLDKAVSLWDDNFCISQFRETYQLCHSLGMRCTISRDDFKELIVRLFLIPDRSTIFKSGTTWRR